MLNSNVQGIPNRIEKTRALVIAPPVLCIYDEAYYNSTVMFFDEFEYHIFTRFDYVELDFSSTIEITAAAALILFAKITRCQCWAPPQLFSNPDQIIELILPTEKKLKKRIVDSGLWSAIKPGGQRKLAKLWRDNKNPYKTGSDPANELGDMIRLLRQQFNKTVPRHIVAAIQEAYLNIAHHAYEEFKHAEEPLHEFMVGRWWQFAQKDPKTNHMAVVIYDMGSGIPKSISDKTFTGSDSSEIHKAMQTGVTRLNIQGRGMGFDNIKKPIEHNATADYLGIYSGKGKIFYRRGKVIESVDHDHTIGGTLIEWVFGEE
ncbi:hypothetical protein [Stutzerimonas stutzeri]|uniref:hypothetical protein n=1 Tax=Stutzerimonas stutzeri TaxID=316 RepID=UPI0003664922|nr:hypothetical protein [Stutzerimonas stutzeri]